MSYLISFGCAKKGNLLSFQSIMQKINSCHNLDYLSCLAVWVYLILFVHISGMHEDSVRKETLLALFQHWNNLDMYLSQISIQLW